MLEVGETVERYRVEGLLGSNGLAALYRVRHLQLGTTHALKVLIATSPSDRARLFAEGQIQAKLRHPNIVAVTDVLLVKKAPALVLELMEGPSLEQWLADAGGRIALDRALALFRGVVTGVGVAHCAGLVHRDLNPTNVLLGLGPSGLPIAKVTGFGLVRVRGADDSPSSSGPAIGTPAYSAPEQIRNPAAVDARADLWALGCLLYELVSGARAFPDTEPIVLYEMVASARYNDLGAAVPPLAPAGVTDVIRDLLRSDPDARIVSCAHLWERLWNEAAPPELRNRTRLRLDEPVALEASLELGTSLDEDAGLEAPPTLVPDEDDTDDGPATPPEPRIPIVALATIEARPWWTWPRGRVAARAVALPVMGLVVLLIGEDPRPPPAQASARVELALPTAVQPMPPVAAPTPIAPAPEPTMPRPRPPATLATSTGRVTVEGDAAEVWLDAGGRRFEVGRSVPARRYVVRASFGDGVTRHAGEIEVRAQAETRVRCAAFVYACVEVQPPRR